MKFVESERLVYGRLIRSDVETLVECFNNKKIRKGIVGLPPHFNDEMALDMVYDQDILAMRREQYLFAIRLKGSTELIGCISLHNITNDSVEIGYWISDKHWSNGYATESTKAVIDFTFSRLNIKKINAVVSPKNKASLKVLSKLGMIEEKVLKTKILLCYKRLNGN